MPETTQSFTVRLTQADRSQQAQGIFWREAGREEGLQDVVGEGESDHSLVCGVDDQHRNPKPQKAGVQHRRGRGLMGPGNRL